MVSSKIPNKWIDEIKVGPWFEGWRMREGAAERLGSMSYSYGYVARVKGSEKDTNGSWRLQNETTDIKNDLINGELVLIETGLNIEKSASKNKLIKKEDLLAIIGGYTKKKFLLIGVGNDSKQIEFQGLISIVQDSDTKLEFCEDKVTEQDFGGESSSDILKQARAKLGESGMYVPGNNKNLTNQGRVLFGNCRRQFYERKETNERGIKVVEQLQDETKKQVGFLALNVKNGMDIAIGVGIKKQTGREYVTPGVVIKRNFSDGKTLWVGIQEDGKIRYINGVSGDREKNQGWMVIHDWTEKNGKFEKEKIEQQLSKESYNGNNGKIVKISLSDARKYYLWDPSYTEIKEGKLITKDNKELPFKLEVKKFTETELLK